MLAYVFGHELTHALWVLLFRGKVKSISVTRNGGSIKATKANPVIILAPYFFPLYTLIIIGAWLLADYFFPIEEYFPLIIFLIGFTWSFHLLLNLYILRVSQHDVRAVGRVLSGVLIYTLNVLILGLLIAFISRSLHFTYLFRELRLDLFLPYKVVFIWAFRILEYLKML